ncbi:hypothetical protein FGU71_07030 [Erythrobacter insulae]|uniref:Uncharacterized protein n=1 Tax=Erythrobacter insulae TaxID=2584124 RepID=A0A547PBX6_9SPHN|nr:hypothetical protein [Erythrobacter insulae]TRD11641.1 hypothetical protein FGU71_07030 [Erythrobacter insulae]
MEEPGKAAGNRIAIIGAASVIVMIALLAYFGMQQEEPEPTVPSSEWTRAPEGGVKVDLPETPLRTVPIEPAEGPSEETADQSEQE